MTATDLLTKLYILIHLCNSMIKKHNGVILAEKTRLTAGQLGSGTLLQRVDDDPKGDLV